MDCLITHASESSAAAAFFCNIVPGPGALLVSRCCCDRRLREKCDFGSRRTHSILLQHHCLSIIPLLMSTDPLCVVCLPPRSFIRVCTYTCIQEGLHTHTYITIYCIILQCIHRNNIGIIIPLTIP